MIASRPYKTPGKRSGCNRHKIILTTPLRVGSRVRCAIFYLTKKSQKEQGKRKKPKIKLEPPSHSTRRDYAAGEGQFSIFKYSIPFTKSTRNKDKYLTTHAPNRLLFTPDGFLEAPEVQADIEETARTGATVGGEDAGSLVIGSAETGSAIKLLPLSDSRFFTKLRI